MIHGAHFRQYLEEQRQHDLEPHFPPPPRMPTMAEALGYAPFDSKRYLEEQQQYVDKVSKLAREKAHKNKFLDKEVPGMLKERNKIMTESDQLKRLNALEEKIDHVLELLKGFEKIEIKDSSGSVLHTSTKTTLKEAVEEAVCSDVDLTSVDLSNADLTNANLRFADLTDADLRNAILQDANLKNVNLSNADLTGANLRSADLTGVQFNAYTNVQGANFAGAISIPKGLKPL